MDMAMNSGPMEARIPENTFMEVKLEKEDLIGRMVGLMKAILLKEILKVKESLHGLQAKSM